MEWVDDMKRASNSKSSKATSAKRFETMSGRIGGRASARHDARSSSFLNFEKICFQIMVSRSES